MVDDHRRQGNGRGGGSGQRQAERERLDEADTVRFEAMTADAAIAAQVAYFSGLGQAFECKVYAYDQPGDLVDRLAARGFEIDQPEAVMVLDVADYDVVESLNVRCTWHG